MECRSHIFTSNKWSRPRSFGNPSGFFGFLQVVIWILRCKSNAEGETDLGDWRKLSAVGLAALVRTASKVAIASIFGVRTAPRFLKQDTNKQVLMLDDHRDPILMFSLIQPRLHFLFLDCKRAEISGLTLSLFLDLPGRLFKTFCIIDARNLLRWH